MRNCRACIPDAHSKDRFRRLFPRHTNAREMENFCWVTSGKADLLEQICIVPESSASLKTSIGRIASLDKTDPLIEVD